MTDVLFLLSDPSVFLLSPWKPLIIWAVVVFWAWLVATKIQANATFYQFSLSQWNMAFIACCGIGVAIMPWKLIASTGGYIFTWLIGYSALLGPIAGIMLCDYFIIRRTKLDVDDLYDPYGQYGGSNWAAIAALILGVLPNLPGFINAATGTAGTTDASFSPIFDQIYSYAWFVGLPVAAIFYWLFMLVRTPEPPSQPSSTS